MVIFELFTLENEEKRLVGLRQAKMSILSMVSDVQYVQDVPAHVTLTCA